MKHPMTRFASISLQMSPWLLCAVLAGCGSVIPDSKVDYKTQGEAKGAKLDVPPDLSQIGRESRYALPGVGVSANDFNNSRNAQRGNAVTNALGDVRLERLGTDRWLSSCATAMATPVTVRVAVSWTSTATVGTVRVSVPTTDK